MIVGEMNLVFQGGGVRGIAYLGALAELLSRGVHCQNAAGTSVGGLVAAIAATAPDLDFVTTLIRDIEHSDLLREHVFVPAAPALQGMEGVFVELLHATVGELPEEFPLRQALTQVLKIHLAGARYTLDAYERWVEETLRQSLDIPASRRDPIMFSEMARPLAIYATDLANRDLVVWSTVDTPSASVAAAVAASAAAWPFFLPRTVGDGDRPVCVSRDSNQRVHSHELADGGWLANLPLEALNRLDPQGAFKSLALRLRSDPKESPKSDFERRILAVSNLVIEGGQRLELARHPGVTSIVIQCGDIDSFNATLDTNGVRSLISAGRKAVRESVIALPKPDRSTPPLDSSGVSMTRSHTLIRIGESIRDTDCSVLLTLPIGASETESLAPLEAVLPWIELRLADQRRPPISIRVLIDGPPDVIRRDPRAHRVLAAAKQLGIAVRAGSVTIHAVVSDSQDEERGLMLIREILHADSAPPIDPLLAFRQIVVLRRRSNRRLFDLVHAGLEDNFAAATKLCDGDGAPCPTLLQEHFRKVPNSAIEAAFKRAWASLGPMPRGVRRTSARLTKRERLVGGDADERGPLYARVRQLEAWRLVRASVIAELCSTLHVRFGEPLRLVRTPRISLPPVVIRFATGEQLVLRGRHRLWHAMTTARDLTSAALVLEIQLDKTWACPPTMVPWRHLTGTVGSPVGPANDGWRDLAIALRREFEVLGDELNTEA